MRHTLGRAASTNLVRVGHATSAACPTLNLAIKDDAPKHVSHMLQPSLFKKFQEDQINSFSFPTTVSTSALVLCLLKENLTVTRLGLLLIARIT